MSLFFPLEWRAVITRQNNFSLGLIKFSESLILFFWLVPLFSGGPQWIICVHLFHKDLPRLLFHHTHEPFLWPSSSPLVWQLHPHHFSSDILCIPPLYTQTILVKLVIIITFDRLPLTNGVWVVAGGPKKNTSLCGVGCKVVNGSSTRSTV